MLKKVVFLFCCLLITCSLHAQKLSVSLTEELVIGGDENASEEYLFTCPTEICTDSQNNIYVADYNRSEIRVFNRQGEYIKSIGKKGKGPGEILEVLSMTIDENDNLIVVDRSNDRFTVFTDFGNNFRVYPMTVDHVIDAFIIAPLGSEEYLLYYLRKSKNKGYYTTAKDKVLHVYSKDFSTIPASFAAAEEICNMDDQFIISEFGRDRAHFCVLNPDTVIYVPEYYNGILYSYVRKNGKWHLWHLKGKKPKYKSYEILNSKDYLHKAEPSYSSRSNGPIGNFFVRVQNRSLAIFILDDGKIIHFTRRRISKNKWIMAAELFERNGRFIGYCEVKDDLTLNFNEGDTPIFNEILWYDKGIVYGNALSNYSPVVRTARLGYEIGR